MPWTSNFERWFRRRAAPPVETEVDEELMFHLRAMVDDNLAAGMPPDAAWRNAQDRFGSFRRHANACRPASLADRIASPRFAIVAVLVVAGLTVWTAFEVRSLQSRVAATEAGPSGSVLTPTTESDVRPAAQGADLAGHVVDHKGLAIPGADVVVVLKTWPDGRFRQHAFAATSDEEGRFRLPDLVPADGQAAVQVAVFKDGYALSSTYQLREEGGRLETETLTFSLDAAPRMTLVIQDERGRPVPNALVVPASRRSADGEDHLVYFQASEPLQSASDSEGRVGLGCFERGDRAEVYVRPPGRDWQLHSLAIPSDGETVAVTTTRSRSEPRRSGSG